MKLKEACLIVAAAVMLCIFAQPTLAASAIRVEPVYMDVWQDDEFTVNIIVDPAENEVYGASYTLYFNNTLLKATSWTQGEFLTRDGESSNVWIHEIDNILGKVEYAEVRMGTDSGVGGAPGNLTTITFEVIGEEGISSLNISDLDGELLYSTSGSIPTTVYNGRAGIARTQSPFVISGYVYYENGSEYDDPAVTITNMDIGEEWVANTNETSNYYQIVLASCADVIAGETLEFNATNPDGSQWNVTEHTVTLDEVNAGGFENNITLDMNDVYIKSDYGGAYGTGIRIDNATTEKIPLDQYLTIGDTYFIKYKVENNGTVDTETVDIAVMISNATWSEELANYPKDIISHHLGNVTWNTAGLAQGNYDITVGAGIPMDCNPGDNERTREVTLGTAEPDNTAPVITDVANTTPTTDSVTITWTTDEVSDSVVRYGTVSITYTISESDATMVTSHSITLTGLSLNTTYYFVVNSTDSSDNSNESEEHSFTTAAVGPPELISCVITPTPPIVQGTNVSIDCLFSERVDYGIRIENATGALIENIGSGTATNPDPEWWNTTTGTPAGIYTVNVTMDNSTGLSSYNDTNTIEVTDASDITPPIVISHAPTGTGVPVSTNITATFDEAMNPDTLNNETVTVEHNGTAVAGNITYDASSKTVTFDPADDLNYSETYNATITTGVQDIAGSNISSNVIWNFTTGSRVIEATISIGNASGNVTVPITIENAANIGSAHIKLTYNASVCMITDVTNGTFDCTFANLEHNETGWASIGTFQTDNPGLNGSVILANVTFRSNSTNGTSPLNMSVVTFTDATPQCNRIPYITQNGTYTAALNGDVNGDGNVTITDAMYLAKHVLGITGFEIIIVGAADVNGDGVINIADAMYLAKHVLGKSGFEELR